MRIISFFAGAALLAAMPALAQTEAIQPAPTTGPSSAAAAANDTALGEVAARPVLQVRPEDQAAYDADMAAYRAALATNQAVAAVDTAIAARNERAYADAMRAWRIQVIDCRRGITAACRAPTPRPGDFM